MTGGRIYRELDFDHRGRTFRHRHGRPAPELTLPHSQRQSARRDHQLG